MSVFNETLDRDGNGIRRVYRATPRRYGRNNASMHRQPAALIYGICFGLLIAMAAIIIG